MSLQRTINRTESVFMTTQRIIDSLFHSGPFESNSCLIWSAHLPLTVSDCSAPFVHPVLQVPCFVSHSAQSCCPHSCVNVRIALYCWSQINWKRFLFFFLSYSFVHSALKRLLRDERMKWCCELYWNYCSTQTVDAFVYLMIDTLLSYRSSSVQCVCVLFGERWRLVLVERFMCR